MLLGKESTTAAMTTEEIQELLASVSAEVHVGAGLASARKRVLVIIPGRTRNPPIPLFFRLLYVPTLARCSIALEKTFLTL